MTKSPRRSGKPLSSGRELRKRTNQVERLADNGTVSYPRDLYKIRAEFRSLAKVLSRRDSSVPVAELAGNRNSHNSRFETRLTLIIVFLAMVLTILVVLRTWH